jgi:hypothetical protein
MKNSNIWMITLWAGTLFLSGAVAGFFVSHLITALPQWNKRQCQLPTPTSAEKIKAMMSERTFMRLELTTSQQQQARQAIDRWVERIEQLRQEHSPEYQAVFMELFDRMATGLTPLQKLELEKIRMEITEPQQAGRKQHRYGKNQSSRQ